MAAAQAFSGGRTGNHFYRRSQRSQRDGWKGRELRGPIMPYSLFPIESGGVQRGVEGHVGEVCDRAG